MDRVRTWADPERAAGRFTPVSRAVSTLLRLAAGDADPLSGQYITVDDDLDALVAACPRP